MNAPEPTGPRGAPDRLCSVRLLSANPDGTAAIACIELTAPVSPAGSAVTPAAFEQFLHLAGIAPLPVGSARVINLGNIDRAFAVRWSESSVTVMPHAGPLIVAAVLDFLLDKSGATALPEATTHHPGSSSPSPDTSDFHAPGPELCARHLHATLAAAASPAAVDLLLDQPRRWAAFTGDWHAPAVLARSRTLRRLLREPTIAAVGPPNIGKSSLLNALAGRAAALVADESGTTRDHVGVSLVLGSPAGGLAVRWLDAPGFRPSGHSTDLGGLPAAWRAALGLIQQAELVLLCGDADQPPLDAEAVGLRAGQPTLRLALRSDRRAPAWPHDLAIGGLGGVKTGGVAGGQTPGIGELIARLHTDLVPTAVIADAGPWAFWL